MTEEKKIIETFKSGNKHKNAGFSTWIKYIKGKDVTSSIMLSDLQ